MYKDKIISVLIPAYNEEQLISKVIDVVPSYVDKLLVVNDGSSDKTQEIVKQMMEKNSKISLINHKKNCGVGAAMATAYKWARDNDVDVAVVMGGDAQMDPNDMQKLLDPVLENNVDYAKGNRLIMGNVRKEMPTFRYYGNQILSLLTKIASGYWHIGDSQCGYVAINKKALKGINWDEQYTDYGHVNDLLVLLNVENFRVKDVPVQPIYNIGEKSGINVGSLLFKLSWLLLKRFLWRLKIKYVVKDFHPLVFFYALGWFFWGSTIVLSVRVLYFWIYFDTIPSINALAAFFSFMSASLFTLFAMWFDMDANKNLR